MLDKIIEKKRVFSDIFDRARRNQMSWRSISIRYEKKMEVFSKKGSGLFFPMPLLLFHFPFQSVLLNSSALSPNFFSGIVERAKREHEWKSPHGVSPFPRGVIFTRADVSLALLSLRKNEDYFWSKAWLNVFVFCSFFLSFILSFHWMRTFTITMTSAICPSWTEVNQRLL